MEEFVTTCPHCFDNIIIKKINCGIFIHGVVIKTGKQINPHSSKSQCDKYIKKKNIYGCGKPYKIIKEENKYKTIIVEYNT
jgi:hypothetical protein